MHEFRVFVEYSYDAQGFDQGVHAGMVRASARLKLDVSRMKDIATEAKLRANCK